MTSNQNPETCIKNNKPKYLEDFHMTPKSTITNQRLWNIFNYYRKKYLKALWWFEHDNLSKDRKYSYQWTQHKEKLIRASLRMYFIEKEMKLRNIKNETIFFEFKVHFSK